MENMNDIKNKDNSRNMKDTKNRKDTKPTKKRTPKQIAALFCVILLAAVYLLTLLCACLDFPGADKMFATCLYATIGLPILLWVYIWFYGIIKERRADTLADAASSVCTNETDEGRNDIS